MNLEHAQQLFIGEAFELLEEMESLLLDVESQDAPIEEHIDAIFRAAHTIKGSAGLFGFDEVVHFTHNVESVLDKVRAKQLTFDSVLAELILDCQNFMLQMIKNLDEGGKENDSGQAQQLTQALTGYLGEQALQEDDFSPAPNTTKASPDIWVIDIQYDHEVFKDGMDPASQLKFLQSFGQLLDVTITPHFPSGDFDPEVCYLAVELLFESSAGRAQIAEAFEFIEPSSEVKITTFKDMLEVLSHYPEQVDALKSRLSQCGVSPAEPEEAIQQPALTTNTPPTESQHPTYDNASPPSPSIEPQTAKVSKFKSLKVDADKLDVLITLIGELVTAGAENEVIVSELGDERLDESFSSMIALVEQIRDSALSLRMVQIGESFGRLKRIVRDVSKELKKEIHLEVKGSETELDKSMVEKLTDPLMHIARNAIDHGIEAQEIRTQQGKSAKGHITLNAFHEAGAVVIEVKDDGAGLDPEKIKTKALEKGLISPQQSLTTEACYNLIFEPGFSTAANVTNLSGRGVGMDVVKRNIEELRGQITINSELGQGSTFRIRLPLTLAIIDGFHVSIADSDLVIPVSMIQECLSFDCESLPNDRNYFNLRGDVLPFIRLRDIFSINESTIEQEHIVVVQFGDKRAGLVVDNLHGELQAVIKPLNKMFRAIKGVGGTTILGTGEVGFILDVPQLIEFAVHREVKKCTEPQLKINRIDYE
ncbi:chemotaxis protein CheA [Pseudoalteromonas piscicida]|uniref:Chemotaxis protein CheA n=1 Tax=Pseudoalteromonas piscicida TaxID=43662 RepID=A0A2A5JP09_PSEO7|nr:chemotaxis protein CheA [Pseudoalteromonas piscicida]PCK31140.1 chemotaxis protein CheA [Pseudoalteromonas piscicida]